jgi:ribosomal protein L11 methyltransferase
MDYYELIFTTHPTEDYQQDILINALGEIGFDTFEELDFGFNAYIPASQFDEHNLDDVLGRYREMFTFSYEISVIPQKNWNELWESNFEPITVGNKIFVRATFHKYRPEYPYEIIIDPKMAFGTGHHQTTAMMLELMLEGDFAGKRVLDMGCGTGILAIMATKLGSAEVVAIDNDPVCFESTLENAKLNNAENICAICGSKETIPNEKFDIILANINRNILVDQVERYSKILKLKGEIYLSGFFEKDLELITAECRKHHLKYKNYIKNKDWVAVKFIKLN